MAKKALPCPTVLRQLLRYDPKTGSLYWLRRKPYQFEGTGRYSADRRCNTWNAKFAGKEALSVVSNHGNHDGTVLGARVKAHRAAWAIFYGEWPSSDLDHINGNPTDNRMENLRLVTHRENMLNQKKRSTNTSGATGVYWYKKNQNWIVKIGVKNKLLHVGYFDSYEDAVEARMLAEVEHGYHLNHGVCR